MSTGPSSGSMAKQQQQPQLLWGAEDLLVRWRTYSAASAGQIDANGQLGSSRGPLLSTQQPGQQLLPPSNPEVVEALEHLALELSDGWEETPSDIDLKLAIEYQLLKAGSLPGLTAPQQQLQWQHSSCSSHAGFASTDLPMAAAARAQAGVQQTLPLVQRQQQPVQVQQQLQFLEHSLGFLPLDEQPTAAGDSHFAWATLLLQHTDAAGSAEELFGGLNELLEGEINCNSGSGSIARHSGVGARSVVSTASSGLHKRAEAQLQLAGPAASSACAQDERPGAAVKVGAAAGAATSGTQGAASATSSLSQQCQQQGEMQQQLPGTAAVASPITAADTASPSCLVFPGVVIALGSSSREQQQQQHNMMAAVVHALSKLGGERRTAGSSRGLAPHLQSLGINVGQDALQHIAAANATHQQQQVQLQQLQKNMWQLLQQQHFQAAQPKLQQGVATSGRLQQRVRGVAKQPGLLRPTSISRTGDGRRSQQQRRATFGMGPQQLLIQQEMLRKQLRREQRRQQQQQKRLQSEQGLA